jgi:hypothetical protein
LQEYENNHSPEEQEICCDENTLCVPNEEDEKVTNSNENKMVIADTNNYNNEIYSDKGKNGHSKNTEEDEESNIEYLNLDLKLKIKEELEKSHREQLILLKENKQTIIDFLIGNKNSIRVEDLKIYESIYKCYQEKKGIAIFVTDYQILFV